MTYSSIKISYIFLRVSILEFFIRDIIPRSQNIIMKRRQKILLFKIIFGLIYKSLLETILKNIK